MVQGGVLHHELSNILHALRFGLMNCGPPPHFQHSPPPPHFQHSPPPPPPHSSLPIHPPPLLTSNRTGAAGCCRAGSGAAGCCRACCVAGTGAARGCCSGSGVSGTGPGPGTGWSPIPPGAAQPPPPPSVGGQGRLRCAAMRQGGAGQHMGQTVSGAPRSTGARQPVCRPAGGGGGAFGPGLHSAGAAIGRGGASNPPQPHLRARAGERTARDLGRVAPRRIPHRMGAQVLPSRRDTLGGGRGVRALYICIQMYIDELSPTNPLVPSIALASRT